MSKQVFMALPSGQKYVSRVVYTVGDSNGVLALVVISTFSLVAALGLLTALAVSAFNTRKSVNPHLFTRSHVAAYLSSLLIGDVLQALGSIMNARWHNEMGVTEGPFCITQGVIKQSADLSTSVWSFLIALNTFLVLFMRLNLGRLSLFAFLIGGWSLILLILIIGPATATKDRGPFYGISGLWCWISDDYPWTRVPLDYMFLFIAAFGSLLLYVLVFFNLRGNITMHGWRVRLQWHRDRATKKEVDKHSVMIARQMLWYPVAYTLLVFPIATCRFVEWGGHDVSDEASFFSDAVFLMSGIVNVTLFLTTRRVLPEGSVIPKSVSYWVASKLSRKKPGPSVRFITVPTAIDIEKANEDSLNTPGLYSVDLNAKTPVHDRDSYGSEITIQVHPVDDACVPPVRETHTEDRVHLAPTQFNAEEYDEDAHEINDDHRTPPGLEYADPYYQSAADPYYQSSQSGFGRGSGPAVDNYYHQDDLPTITIHSPRSAPMGPNPRSPARSPLKSLFPMSARLPTPGSWR